MLAASLPTGCGINLSADPQRTLERVCEGHLRIGVSTHALGAETRDGAEPAGIEPDLVRKFAVPAPYGEAMDEHGETHKHVMATLPGKNAFLLTDSA